MSGSGRPRSCDCGECSKCLNRPRLATYARRHDRLNGEAKIEAKKIAKKEAPIPGIMQIQKATGADLVRLIQKRIDAK